MHNIGEPIKFENQVFRESNSDTYTIVEINDYTKESKEALYKFNGEVKEFFTEDSQGFLRSVYLRGYTLVSIK